MVADYDWRIVEGSNWSIEGEAKSDKVTCKEFVANVGSMYLVVVLSDRRD